MTTLIWYDDQSYQFLHLSIQEFLAAWWIAKYLEDPEEVFIENLHNAHFQMCLRFLAGLTQLKHERYQQCLSKELNLQCNKRPLFGFEDCYQAHFFQSSDVIKPLIRCKYSSDRFKVLFIHLLYESQNVTLCQILSKAMTSQSLCVNRIMSSSFDMLCLSYFLNNSNTVWNCLHLGSLYDHEVQLLTNRLTDNIQTKILQFTMRSQDYNQIVMMRLFQNPLFHNLQQCYISLVLFEHLSNLSDVVLVLVQMIKLQHLKVLHFHANIESKKPKEHCINKTILSELEKTLSINTTLHELVATFETYPGLPSLSANLADIGNSVIKGVTRNKFIQAFLLT